MARYGFPRVKQDRGRLANKLCDWLKEKGLEATLTDNGTSQRIVAKRANALRDISGMSSTFTFQCEAFDTEGVTTCTITRETEPASLKKAAVLGFFTAGATWVAAGVAATQAASFEEESVTQLEKWMGCKRLPADAPLPASHSDGTPPSPQPETSDQQSSLATAVEISGTAVAAASTLASGFLWGAGAAAKALGHVIRSMVYYTCPKCNATEYDKKIVDLQVDEKIKTAYRYANGTLNSHPPLSREHPYTQVQAVYTTYVKTWELTCRKCGKVWKEKEKGEHIK